MLPSLWMSRTRETVKPTPAKPLKWAAYGAFFGALIIVWGPNLFGLPGALNSEPIRIYGLMGEIIGGAVAGGVGAYVGAVIHNSLRR